MSAEQVVGAVIPKQEITMGDFTYTQDEDGNIRRWVSSDSSARSFGPGGDIEKVISEHDIPHEVLRHFGLG